MALFKIEKGLAENLMKNRPNAKEGYAYFTTDDGKFYIDVAGDGTTAAAAVIPNDSTPISSANRIPLNAYQADSAFTVYNQNDLDKNATTLHPLKIWAGTQEEYEDSVETEDPYTLYFITNENQDTGEISGSVSSSKIAESVKNSNADSILSIVNIWYGTNAEYAALEQAGKIKNDTLYFFTDNKFLNSNFGTENAGKALIVGEDGKVTLTDKFIYTSDENIETTLPEGTSANINMDDYVTKDQGSENAGKILSVGNDGNITLINNTSGGGTTLPSYLKTNYIDSTTIVSPTIVGSNLWATGSGNNTNATGTEHSAYYITNGVTGTGANMTPNAPLGWLSYDNTGAGTESEAQERVWLHTEDNVALKLASGAGLSLQTSNNSAIHMASETQFWDKIRARSSDIYGYSLPSTGEVGQIFFVLQDEV